MVMLREILLFLIRYFNLFIPDDTHLESSATLLLTALVIFLEFFFHLLVTNNAMLVSFSRLRR